MHHLCHCLVLMQAQVQQTIKQFFQFAKEKLLFVCYFCGGGKWHPRSQCLAKNKTCDFCDKVGHYAKCCLSKKKSANCVGQPSLATTTALQSTFSNHVLAEITLNNITTQALVDISSTSSYVNEEFVKKAQLALQNCKLCCKYGQFNATN